MAFSNLLLLCQITGYIIAFILSLCITVPMSIHQDEFRGHCLLFSTGIWQEKDGQFGVNWASQAYCNYTIFVGVILFITSVVQIYRMGVFLHRGTDSSFLSAFVDVVGSVILCLMTIVAALMITLGFMVWCKNMTERFPSCEIAAGNSIDNKDGIETAGFYIEMGTAQFGAWASWACWVGLSVCALLKLCKYHQLENIRVSMYRERQRLLNGGGGEGRNEREGRDQPDGAEKDGAYEGGGDSIHIPQDEPSAQKVKEADVLYDQNKFKEILHVLHPFKEEKNDEVLWRLGRALYKLSQEISDPKQKKEMIFEAYNYVSEALSINEKNSAVHKWMSIMIDAKSKYQGLKEKITQAYVMKKHMLRAVELNPKDATVLHLLGTWCFEVANMAWYERKVASTIFAAPPNSSFEEALSFFVKAEETDPCFYSMNLLMLGKTYLKLNNKDKAKHYLELAQGYPQKTAEDAQAKNEATSLLAQL